MRDPAGSRRGGAGEDLAGLELLADAAVGVDECRLFSGGRECGHSDPFACFFTAKQRKSDFLKTHYSLFLNPSPKPMKPPLKNKTTRVKRPPSITNFPPAIPAPAAPLPPPAVRIPPSFAIPPTLSQGEFVSKLEARVSAIVGGYGGVVLRGTFTLVIAKQLQVTDLKLGNLRLSIPVRQIRSDFFTDEEKTLFVENGEEIELGFFLDPKLELNPGGVLVKWKMGTSVIYNVNGPGWRSVLEKRLHNRLKLEAKDRIELWSFRVDSGELCFVMVNEETKRILSNGAAAESGGSGISTVTNEEKQSPVLQVIEDEASGSRIELELAAESGRSGISTHEEKENPVLQLLDQDYTNGSGMDLELRL